MGTVLSGCTYAGHSRHYFNLFRMVLCTWRLFCLTVERTLLTLVEVFVSFVAQTGETPPLPLQGLHFWHCIGSFTQEEQSESPYH